MALSVTVAKQLCIFLQNKPGVLAKLCRALAAEKIDMKAISVADSLDHAVVRLVVDKPVAARRLFEDHNLLVIENDLVGLTLPDRPGELGRVAARLAKARLNISYLYGSVPAPGRVATIFMRVEAPSAKVLAALKGL
ncbi:MAG TPA: ACT domain-containing protein [Planctomycetota bacterium]|nr:ACT domain-containing protein [Planctomycetota bacterium]